MAGTPRDTRPLRIFSVGGIVGVVRDLADQPRWRDWASAVAVLLVGTLLIELGVDRFLTDVGIPALQSVSGWWHLVFLLPGCLLMVAKRRRPVVALLGGCALGLGDLGLGGSVGMLLVLCDVLYGVGVHGSPRARNAAMTGVVIVIATGSVLAALAFADLRAGVLMALQLIAIGVVPLWWAANIRQERDIAELAVARARAEAVHSERGAMARDLHDVVAAQLSTIALHSGAVLALEPDHSRDRETLGRVRENSLRALEEMRTMIEVLRDGDTTDQPATANLSQITDLVEDLRSAGHRISGAIEFPADPPPLIAHSGYRIAVEALTNAAKHGAGGPIRFVVGVSGDSLMIEVANPVPQRRRHRAPEPGTGTGLWSMTTRAHAIGGEFTVATHNDEWVVRAELPLDADAVPRRDIGHATLES